MPEYKSGPGFAEELRLRAERYAGADRRKSDDMLSPAEIRKVLHELHVHQIELEMQNEELRRTQAELEISHARYFDLYDLAPVGYCTLNDKNLILEANLTIGMLLGRTRGDLTGHQFTRFIFAGDQDGFYIFRRNLSATPGQHLCEVRLVKEDGDLFWAQLEAVVSDDKDGATICRLAISDVTRRKQVEEKLEETGKELERIVALQKKVITDTRSDLNHETDGRILAETELTHRQEALEAVYAMETAPDFTLEALYDQIVSSIAATLHIPMVSISEYRDGRIIRGSHCLDGTVSRRTIQKNPGQPCAPVSENGHLQQSSGDRGSQFDDSLCFDHGRFQSYAGVPVKSRQGEVFGLITVLDDKRREFDGYEIKFIEIFSRYISHEISRRQLESQIRRNEEMHQLGKLTSGVAHEVRNPLNGILAVMGALEHELADEERFRPYMDHMGTQVTRLTVLMENLLTLGRPVRRENLEVVPMVAVFENALAAWFQTLQHAKPAVRLIQPQTPRSCMINADETALAQMIINLLENACNHSPAGAEIVCSIVDGNDGNAVFTVKDRGAGIPEKSLQKIFDPFFTTRKGGTGLGLSIVRTIVENHHGSITAGNNTDGPGATFTVVLPLHAWQPDEAPAQPVPAG